MYRLHDEYAAKLMEQRTIATTAPEVLAHLINGGLMDAALWIANQQDEDCVGAGISRFDAVAERLAANGHLTGQGIYSCGCSRAGWTFCASWILLRPLCFAR